MIKQFLPTTLFGRSLLILIVPVLLIQIITTIVFFDRHWTKMTNRLAFAVAGEIAVMSEAIENDPSPESIEKITSYASRGLELLLSYEPDAVLDMDQKQRSFSLWEALVADTLAEQMELHVRKPFIVDADFQEKWVEIRVQLSNGVLDVSLPERRLFSSSGYIFLIWMISVSFVLLIIAVLFMRGQVRPIRRLGVAAERFGKGQEVPDFKPQGAREVRQAAEAFIKMSKRIKRQIEQRTLMLAGVSHDLRTPITRLKLQLSMMGDSQDVADMKSDIADMERMIEGYLDFVRGAAEEELEMVSVPALLEKVAKTASMQGKQVDFEFKAKTSMLLRPGNFERAMANVVGNASRYADRIKIVLDEAEGKAIIEVHDDGPGIAEDQYGEVFKPFTRIDESRNTETGGVGLGLPITQDIVHTHGGKIELGQSDLGGLKVRVSLPL